MEAADIDKEAPAVGLAAAQYYSNLYSTNYKCQGDRAQTESGDRHRLNRMDCNGVDAADEANSRKPSDKFPLSRGGHRLHRKHR
jgi:hypothetical protein